LMILKDGVTDDLRARRMTPDPRNNPIINRKEANERRLKMLTFGGMVDVSRSWGWWMLTKANVGSLANLRPPPCLKRSSVHSEQRGNSVMADTQDRG